MIRVCLLGGLCTLLAVARGMPAAAQMPEIRYGEAVPRDVRQIYEAGLQYLVKSQAEDGSWSGGEHGPGVTGMAMMVLLASGEDPNFGLYRQPIRKALRNIISSQDPATGYLGSSMYHHGFGMLALAEAYGVVDERDLWEGAATASSGRRNRAGIGEALELAVRCALTSQRKNPLGAWRYSPDATDADTSVSGAVLVGLLAARNAGIEVPDAAIDRAISYYQKMTSGGGQVGYSGGLGGMGESRARSSIALLCFQIARRSDLPQAKATARYLTSELEATGQDHYAGYTEYYQAQALFQADEEAWEKWNQALVRRFKSTQLPDGSFPGNFGPAASTSLSLLALAVNYRFLPIYER